MSLKSGQFAVLGTYRKNTDKNTFFILKVMQRLEVIGQESESEPQTKRV